MDVAKELRKLILQHFGYFDYEVLDAFNLYDTKLSIDELSDFLLAMEDTFNVDLDESKLPLANFKELAAYIEERTN